METVLITGASGFIGSHLANALADTHKVIAIDNESGNYSSTYNLERLKNHDNVVFEKQDITNKEAIQIIFETYKPDVVVHLAAKAGVRASLEKPIDYVIANVQGTVTMLEVASKNNVKKFLHGSSSSVYGNNAKVPFSEDDKTDNPISPYAATKKASEALCASYHYSSGMPIICFRFFTVYGERGRPDMAIYKFITAIAHEKPITVYGDGTRRDYTYVGDIVRGITAGMNADFKFEIVNLGNSHPVDLPFLISTIEEAVGKKAVIQKEPLQTGDVTQTYADVSKAKSLLSWEPQTSLQDGIIKTVGWWNEHH